MPWRVARAEEGLDQLREMAGDDRQPLEALVVQLPDDHVQDRPVADGHERLRKHRRVGPKAHSETPGENDGTAGHFAAA